MDAIYTHQARIGAVGTLQTTGTASETDLENAIGVAQLADLNAQLSELASSMKEQLEAKQEIREELSNLQSYDNRETATTPSGDEACEITVEEYEELQNSGYDTLQFVEKEDGSGYYLLKDGLETTINQKQEELAGLNSSSELMALQVQSLVDQRKNALTLLSNLYSGKNEILMNIIRNLKS